MCLIVFAWKVVPAIPLIAASNRDEFYARRTAPVAFWEDNPNIYAGRDLQAGGTWLGITRPGAFGSRFAAITNVRAPHLFDPKAPSRGKLVSDFLASEIPPQDYITDIQKDADKYNGFNLLVGDSNSMIWYSNFGKENPQNGLPLAPGVYGLSNGLLDDPWQKVVRTRAQFASLLCQDAPDSAFFEMLSDTEPAPDYRLPETGVSLELERVLSAVCIVSPEYGTRASYLVHLFGDRPATLLERIIR